MSCRLFVHRVRLALLAAACAATTLVWAVNDAPTMGRMIDMAVDGLITNGPDIAQKVITERGITLR